MQDTARLKLYKNAIEVLTRRNASVILSVETCNIASTEMREGRKNMNTQRVKERMEDMHITVGMMAQELGMDPSTYYRKMQKNGDEFSALDLMVFKRVLDMDEKTALEFLLS